MLREARNDYQILPVCAGGNGDDRGNPFTAKSYPSDYDECMAVTSLTTDGRDSMWSDYNERKDISAPGEAILTTSAGGGVEYTNGTSIASPTVASAAALLWSYKPSLSANDVVSLLTSTASKVSGVSRATNGSAGKLEAGQALSKLTTGSPGYMGADAALANTNTGRFVTRLYQKVLGREPDAGGLRTHVDVLSAGAPAATIIWNSFSSPEFQARSLTNAQRMTIVYNTMLDRTPDAGGLADWTAKLDAGMSMRAIISGSVDSPEFRNLCRSYGITAGKLPYDPAEMAKYASISGATQSSGGSAAQPASLDVAIEYSKPVRCG